MFLYRLPHDYFSRVANGNQLLPNEEQTINLKLHVKRSCIDEIMGKGSLYYKLNIIK